MQFWYDSQTVLLRCVVSKTFHGREVSGSSLFGVTARRIVIRVDWNGCLPIGTARLPFVLVRAVVLHAVTNYGKRYAMMRSQQIAASREMLHNTLSPRRMR